MKNRTLQDELNRLLDNCNLYRSFLLKKGRQRAKYKRNLTLLSGILALISAGIISTDLIVLLGNQNIKMLAAAASTVAGAISLVISTALDDIETAKMISGSSKYHTLREKLRQLDIDPKEESEYVYKCLRTYSGEYSDLDSDYSTYFDNYAKYSNKNISRSSNDRDDYATRLRL